VFKFSIQGKHNQQAFMVNMHNIFDGANLSIFLFLPAACFLLPVSILFFSFCIIHFAFCIFSEAWRLFIVFLFYSSSSHFQTGLTVRIFSSIFIVDSWSLVRMSPSFRSKVFNALSRPLNSRFLFAELSSFVT